MLYELVGTNARILGTMHRVPPNQPRWIGPTKNALAWADELWVEMLLKHGPSLAKPTSPHRADALPADLQTKIGSFWPTALLGALEAANLPSVWLVTSGLDVAMDEGVEFLAEQIAANGGKTISELEDLGSLIQAFDGVPLADFEHLIRARLKRTPQEKAKFEKFYRSWRAHNVPGMTALMRSDILPSVRKAMFDSRNTHWAPTIAAAARTPKNALFLVGAGHLCGEGNVLELLARDFGLEARRLPFQ
ncbi:TraB/GumN family protein [Variovorax sp. M-6]|uniref:TraB/GumN family protein n=1 Tax=Variovorax sp. M-6 TaxID=3233041 RepID=UPI003F9AD584